MSSDLTIRPLVPNEDKEHPLPHHFLPSPTKSFRLLLVGASNSGKSLCLLNMLTRPEFGYYEHFGKENIFVISPTLGLDPTWDVLDLPRYNKMDSWHEQTVQELMAYSKKQETGVLLVLDDLACSDCTNAHKDQLLSKLMMTGRHWGVNLCLTTQKYNAVSTRVRANASHVVCFKLPTKTELKAFLHDNGDVPEIEAKYEAATSRPYGFIYIDRSTGREKQAYRCFEEPLNSGSAPPPGDGATEGGAEAGGAEPQAEAETKPEIGGVFSTVDPDAANATAPEHAVGNA